MTVVLTVDHNFVCPVVDDADPDTVSPSHWNDGHAVGGVDQINTELLAKADKTTTVTAGAGLTGGGDLSANRTLTVGAGTGITVNADDVALDTAHARNVDHSAVSITAGDGLTGGGDLSANRTFNVGAGSGITVAADSVGLDMANAANVDHTGVTLTAGAGLTGGGDISANRTFAVGGSTSIIVGADDVQRAALTGDVTAGQNVNGTTIANNAVSYAKMQDVTATARLLGRKTAAAGDPEECTLSEVLDFIGSATQGDILYRGATAWAKLGAGGAGTLLQSGGVGSNPSWATPAYQASDADLTSWAAVARATGFDTFVATPNSANLRTLLTDEVGAGAAYFVGGALGTPASGTLSGCTDYPLSALTGLGTNVGTFLATPNSANLRSAMTDESGSGALLFADGALGTPASGNLSNCSLPAANLTLTNTNDSAAAGDIGEYFENEKVFGTAVTLTTTTAANICQVSLTAGDWDVWATISFNPSTNPTSQVVAGINTTSATMPSDTGKGARFLQNISIAGGNAWSNPVGTRRISIASTTTVYLVAQATFASTCIAYGVLCARRVR